MGQQVEPFVFDDTVTRSLYFGFDGLQSRMRIADPWRLETDYTRTMMGFLMLRPQPRAIGMIGLGGGSLAKFCWRYLPGSAVVAVEINARVIALRREFQVPDDDSRLQVIHGDGADWVRAARDSLDVLLVDGFDSLGQSPQLCTPAFYEDCRRALRPDGVMVVNLHHDDPDFGRFASRIHAVFAGQAMEVIARERSNCVVFACRGQAVPRESLDPRRALVPYAPVVRRHLLREFERITWDIRPLRD